ncbi:MAG: ImmA/IrrE family metallo-endopeptidase [Pseudomonadota bacterium]|nr:ImmA/IrrE family metallo-endopeptidase [Pseudomonadota bacterium]
MAAQVLGTTRQVIGSFEATKKEAREPRASEILALASLYRISPDTILTTDLRLVRAPDSRPQVLERRDADDADDALDSWELDEASRSAAGTGPGPRPAEAVDVQGAVVALRRLLCLGDKPPFDVFRGMVGAGFVVQFTAMKSLAGALIPESEGRPPVIVINSDQPDDRLRWTAAHEAAHWALGHHPGQRHADPFGTSRDAKEWAADAVAAELLAPMDAFAAAFAERDRTEGLADAVYRLSRRFGLSYAAAAVRLGQRKLLPPDTVTALRTERPTEIESRLGLRTGVAFRAETAVPAAISALLKGGALNSNWASIFGAAEGQRSLRRIQRESLGLYLEEVGEADRLSGVTTIYEETARWVAVHHRIGAAA